MLIRAGRLLITVLALLLCITAAEAQQYQDSRPPAFSQQELDQILAPIALYPDSLLSQIMMAATYPRDVVDAADWSRHNSDLNGDRAVRAVDRYDWDPSVKSLVAFPQILDMMDQKIDWTRDLGDAFLEQQAQVMDTVQYLRRQASVAGNLRSSEQMRVEVRDSSFVIEFANPEVVYLPYYNPVVVYGRWWWPTHQPVYWAPWPGYYSRPGYAYAWGRPIPVSRGFFYSAPDWRNRRVEIVNVNNYYYRPAFEHRADAPRSVVAGTPPVWHHDAEHRRELPQRTGEFQRPGRDANRAPAVNTSVAAPQPVVAAPAPAAAQRIEPARGAESHANDARRFEGRDEQRRDGRFEQNNREGERNRNRDGEHSSVQPPASVAVATPPAPRPVESRAAPVERAQVAATQSPAPRPFEPRAAAPVERAQVTVTQPPAPRAAEPRMMPVPTPAPVAANRPNVEQRTNVARGQENSNRRENRPNNAQEHGNRQDNSENAVAAAGDNPRGNGGGNSHRRE